MTSFADGFSDLFKALLPKSLDEPICALWHANGHCREGFVYLAQYGDLFKIGFTGGRQGRESFQARLASIVKQFGLHGKLVRTIKTNCGAGLERYIHRMLEDRRVNGEFFRLSEQDLAWIGRLEVFNGQAVEHGT